MTTLNPAGSSGDDDWRHRTAMWLGHHEARIGMAGFVAMGGVFLATTLIEHNVVEWILLAAGMAGITLGMVAGECDRRVHRRNLCLLDLDRSPLLDPDTEVTRRAGVLHEYHSPRRRIQVALVAFVFMMTGILVGGWLRDRILWLAVIVSVGSYTVMLAVQIRNIWINDVHQRLQPWCPLCRWGRDDDDDGDDDPEPEPTPPTTERDRIDA